MIINGKEIAQKILEEVRAQTPPGVIVRAVTVAPTLATRSYLKIKERAAVEAGMTLEVVSLPDNASIDEVCTAVQAPGADAVIVQLPLPEDLDESYILASIPMSKDADVLSPLAREEGVLLPPVAGAVREILAFANVDSRGKRAVVIGKGVLVGGPVSAYLAKSGALVETYDKDDFAPSVLKNADIIVSGAGVPSLITPEMITEGVVLIDAGTSEQGGEVVGDADPRCASVASVYTPVPGGVGPVSVACLFKNVLELQKGNIRVH